MIRSGETQTGIFTDVTRCDGEQKTVRVVEGHLLVCKGCCCGNTERNIPPVPVDCFKREWKERGIRTRVHLSISACLGPCAGANVVLPMFHGSSAWFHSINSDADVIEIYNYAESLLWAGVFSLPGAQGIGLDSSFENTQLIDFLRPHQLETLSARGKVVLRLYAAGLGLRLVRVRCWENPLTVDDLSHEAPAISSSNVWHAAADCSERNRPPLAVASHNRTSGELRLDW